MLSLVLDETATPLKTDRTFMSENCEHAELLIVSHRYS